MGVINLFFKLLMTIIIKIKIKITIKIKPISILIKHKVMFINDTILYAQNYTI